jgi:F-type H+-transporting ATPase subunit gamma
MQAVAATRPYASKAWQVLTHVAAQPGRQSLHPLLTERPPGQPGDCHHQRPRPHGAYNTNSSGTSPNFDAYPSVKYIAVGRKGGTCWRAQGSPGDFNLPAAPLSQMSRHWSHSRY